MTNFASKIKKNFKGQVSDDDLTLTKYIHDASIFELKPQVVVIPQGTQDIENLVKFVTFNKKENPNLSITVRAAGTCMSGGPLTDSILIDTTSLNRIKQINKDSATLEPGVYYRDFEKEIQKHNLSYPPFTSSKNICALGGMVANNAGGERSLKYGKAEDFVQELKVVLSDGKEYSFEKLTFEKLKKKISQKSFEGQIYKRIFQLIESNYDLIQKNKPQVTKNSTGYNIWKVWDKKTFDINKLIIGSQGTLGIITEISLKLLPEIKHRGLLIIYMDSFDNLPEIVTTVLRHNPDSFETFDHHTLRLALRYFYGFSKTLHTNFFNLVKQFLPEFLFVLKNGMPKLVLLVEYENDDIKKIHDNLEKLHKELRQFNNIRTKIAKNEKEREKFWAIRRESFNLLRLRIKNRYASPFIDDTIVKPEVLPQFFPKIYKILNDTNLLYTIAGHIGNGNFHIIPLMNLKDKKDIEKIFDVNDQVFDLVLEYKGSLSGEHNDGLIRGPYLKKAYGEEILNIFKEIKNIFDPQNIFNPHKKVQADLKFAKTHIRQTW